MRSPCCCGVEEKSSKLKPPTKLLAAASSSEMYIYNTTKLFYSTINLTPMILRMKHLNLHPSDQHIVYFVPESNTQSAANSHQHNITIAGEEHTTASSSPLDFTVN